MEAEVVDCSYVWVVVVFERLEIGPVKLEPRRLIAPYRLYYNGKIEQTELIYSYEEKVFDPAERESRIIERYPGGIEGRNAPFPILAYLIIIGTIIWVLAYILLIGVLKVKF